MEIAYCRPCILFLEDIRLSDYVPAEDAADEKFRERLCETITHEAEAVEPLVAHEKLPPVFTTLEAWPQHTALKCWATDCTFDDVPKFVPTGCNEVDGKIEFTAHGCFWTFNAAAWWIRTHVHSDIERDRMLVMLMRVYEIFTGKHTLHIESAPDKTEMIQYGGDLDFASYCKKMRDLDPVAVKDHTPYKKPASKQEKKTNK